MHHLRDWCQNTFWHMTQQDNIQHFQSGHQRKPDSSQTFNNFRYWLFWIGKPKLHQNLSVSIFSVVLTLGVGQKEPKYHRSLTAHGRWYLNIHHISSWCGFCIPAYSIVAGQSLFYKNVHTAKFHGKLVPTNIMCKMLDQLSNYMNLHDTHMECETPSRISRLGHE